MIRLLWFIAGLALICVAFAVFGLGFDVIDALRGKPTWMVFALLPVQLIAILIPLSCGLAAFGRAFGDVKDNAQIDTGEKA